MKVENFPALRRLQSLLLSNNRIRRIAFNLGRCLPRLETLVLTNNQIANLEDLDALMHLPTLQRLSLLQNPVCNREVIAASYRNAERVITSFLCIFCRTIDSTSSACYRSCVISTFRRCHRLNESGQRRSLESRCRNAERLLTLHPARAKQWLSPKKAAGPSPCLCPSPSNRRRC